MMQIMKDSLKIGINGKKTILNRAKFREAVKKFEGFRGSINSRRANVYSRERKNAARDSKSTGNQVWWN